MTAAGAFGAFRVHPATLYRIVNNAITNFAEASNLSSAEGCMVLDAVSEFGQPDADLTGVTLSDARTDLSPSSACKSGETG